MRAPNTKPRSRRASLIATVIAIAALGLGPAQVALAAAPPNDDFANATVIDPAALPFSDVVSIDELTVESSGPPCGFSGAGQTVWYAITPTSAGTLRVSDGATFYYQFVAVYRLDDADNRVTVACASWLYGQSQTTFSAEADVTYYIETGSNFESTGTLNVLVELLPPPANDDFAAAKPIATVPYSDSVAAMAATTEPGEPVPSCASGLTLRSIWYAFTAPTSGSFSVSSPSNGGWSQAAVFSGSGLDNLTELGCQPFYGMVTFHAEAGATYYLEVGAQADSANVLNVSLIVTLDPVANIGFSPADPSVFDAVQFDNHSWDPGGLGFGSAVWRFGDGTSISDAGCCPTHRYAADGDYEVTLAVTTVDGRTGTTSRTVSVRTHDVAIMKVRAPATARSGKTDRIVVEVGNRRLPETVTVELYKSVAGGLQQIATTTQSIPARTGPRTTPFVFSYTFTPDDAALGKVTFRAIATINGARDALPADNEAIAAPTKVNR